MTKLIYQKYGKRCLDVGIAIIALLTLAPVLALVLALVRLRMGSPVMFRQVRPGLLGRPFTMLKIRTMTDERDLRGGLKRDTDRLTNLGRFLRRTSLDELPQLLNVIRGEMSLVGPRPMRLDYLEYFTPHELRRHLTRPGITGWAQINGRNSITWDERFQLDVWYVEHQTLFLDLYILSTTAWKVVSSHGVNVDPGTALPDLSVARCKLRTR